MSVARPRRLQLALLMLVGACNPSFDPEWSVRFDSGTDEPPLNGGELDAETDAAEIDAAEIDAGELEDAGSEDEAAVVVPIALKCNVSESCGDAGDASCTRACSASCADACLATGMCFDASLCSVSCTLCETVTPPIKGKVEDVR